MKLGRAPATRNIFKKESLWIGIESITTTGNYSRYAGLEVSRWLEKRWFVSFVPSIWPASKAAGFL
jgi:hypothetical protein